MKTIKEKIISAEEYNELNLEFIKGKVEFHGKDAGLYIISKGEDNFYKWEYFVEENVAYYRLVDKIELKDGELKWKWK